MEYIKNIEYESDYIDNTITQVLVRMETCRCFFNSWIARFQVWARIRELRERESDL